MKRHSPQRIRSPAVAGLFYPAEPDRLAIQIDTFLAGQSQPNPIPKALIVPHAGYVYSGTVAASAYRLLRQAGETIKRVVLLGPSHRTPLAGMAIPSVEAFATPLGNILLDRTALAALANLPQVQIDDAPHEIDHALEVQLPFLQACLQSFSLVPVSVGRCEAAAVARMLTTIWGGEETLIVVSTDLSHFHSYRMAQRIDRNTADAILRCESTLAGEQACGHHALNGLLLASRERGLRPKLLDLRSSGDTAGDHNRVVGYASFVITESNHEA